MIFLLFCLRYLPLQHAMKYCFILILLSFQYVNGHSQARYYDQSNCPADISYWYDNCYYFKMPEKMFNDGWYSYVLFYEKADGTWAEAYPTEGGAMNPAVHTSICNIDLRNLRYFFYYNKGLNNTTGFPTLAEIQAKYGRRNNIVWLFCVAEDKSTGTVFVSQCFRAAENPTLGNMNARILTAFRKHIKDILKDNPGLKIPYDESRINFWVECKIRSYSKAPGNGIHTGMNYAQIRDFTASCATAESTLNESRLNFIKFKNDYGNVDVVYDIDFDYNKVKN